MIRECLAKDRADIYSIVNDAANAYKDVIPADRWHEPYMPMEELETQIADGVVFYGYEMDGALAGVMGIQDKGEVALIRHAYVRTAIRNSGIGSKLLKFLEARTDKPILIGTWLAATWAIGFYKKNGYVPLDRHETETLLKRFWKIPLRQVETSIVLANAAWNSKAKS
jgi:GNAT superfamily N-acetyltransferase